MAGVKVPEHPRAKPPGDTCPCKSGKSWAPLRTELSPSREKGLTPGPCRILSTSVKPTTSLRCKCGPIHFHARAGRPSDALCRKCGSTVETIEHISGHCPSVKDYRIKRHNVITNTVAEKGKQVGWLVNHEPCIQDAHNRVWKPDLVFVRGNGAIVVDPTVAYEKWNSLSLANQAKVDKYSHLIEIINERYGVQDVKIRGLAIGCRGGWHPDNTKTLEEFDIKDPGFEAHLCRLALKGTINLVRLFSDL